MIKHLLFLSIFFLCTCSCTEKNTGNNGADKGNKTEIVKDVTAYVTTSDSKTLFKKSSFSFTDTNVLNSYNIRYDKSKLGNEIDGFGLAVTTWQVYSLSTLTSSRRMI